MTTSPDRNVRGAARVRRRGPGCSRRRCRRWPATATTPRGSTTWCASPVSCTAPSTRTSPTWKACSGRWGRNAPTKADTLAESLGPVDLGPAGVAALRAWLVESVDFYRRHSAVIRASAENQVSDCSLARLGTASFARIATTLQASMVDPD
jgi:hypothetical protein